MTITDAADLALVAFLDENPLLARGFCLSIGQEGRFRAEALVEPTTAPMAEVVRHVARMAPSVLVLDPSRMDTPPDESARLLRAAVPELRLVAYVAEGRPDLARACVEAGFHAFLPKTVEPAQLVRALIVVLDGGVYLDKAFGRALLDAPDAVPADGACDCLSVRERLVLGLLARGLSHKQAAAELEISPKTVDTYKARGMRKLALADRGELVAFALRNGWLDQTA